MVVSSLVVRIDGKHSNMSSRMESFITDAIIIAKLKHSEDVNKMAEAITEKLDDCYCGTWNTIVYKDTTDTGYHIRTCSGTYIQVNHQGLNFTVFKNTTCWNKFSKKYSTYQARLSTFQKWPSYLKQNPKDLAEAGFYYLGIPTLHAHAICSTIFFHW